MSDVDPLARLAYVLARTPEIPLSRLPELLPWNWTRRLIAKAAAPRPMPYGCAGFPAAGCAKFVTGRLLPYCAASEPFNHFAVRDEVFEELVPCLFGGACGDAHVF